MQAAICTIGDEILIGQIIDTNSSHISLSLNEIGVKVSSMLSISDDRTEIINKISELLKTNDIVIVTGGLGPTKDDITKTALAQLSESDGYYSHSGQLNIIHNILNSRGLDLLDINIAQAMVPNKADVILNHYGTAPIMVFHFPEQKFGHKTSLYSLPGVPFEVVNALPDVMNDIKSHYKTEVITHKTIMTFGLAESALSKKIEDWELKLPSNVHLAYLPNTLKGVRLRLSIYGGNEEENHLILDTLTSQLCALIPEYVYSLQDDSLEAKIGSILLKNKLSLSVAESCTGGNISAMFTALPGCSEYYLGSVTSYANSVKENVLKVPKEIIEKYGAVSSECVAEMAKGVMNLTGSDYAVATSGIAGPSGGSKDKPVGLVWVGVASKNGVETCKFTYKNDRKRNIERFSAAALHTLLIKIVNEVK